VVKGVWEGVFILEFELGFGLEWRFFISSWRRLTSSQERRMCSVNVWCGFSFKIWG
jgi:hypothetical protein